MTSKDGWSVRSAAETCSMAATMFGWIHRPSKSNGPTQSTSPTRLKRCWTPRRRTERGALSSGVSLRSRRYLVAPQGVVQILSWSFPSPRPPGILGKFGLHQCEFTLLLADFSPSFFEGFRSIARLGHLESAGRPTGVMHEEYTGIRRSEFRSAGSFPKRENDAR
jgi:hypothetical protein